MGSDIYYWFTISSAIAEDSQEYRRTQKSLPIWVFLLGIIAYLALTSSAYGQTIDYALKNNPTGSWIFNGTADEVEGLGVADYSKFNPEKSWGEALENAVDDLNANHSLIVSHYGYKIGRGPLRIWSDYAIRTFLDTTQVTVLDSARWNGRAFIRVKPSKMISDSILYPSRKFRPVDQNLNTANLSGGQWLVSTGATPRIDSNWYMSVTKAKQDALRKLAEDLSVKVSSETLTKGETSLRFYSFSTMFSFQRIRVLKRIFNEDSIKVQVAVHPYEVKRLME